MKTLIIILILIPTINSFGQDYFKWRFSDEGWGGTDKIFHVTGSFSVCGYFHSQNHNLTKSMLITSLICLAWEVKDAWLPKEKVGFIGGYGFSVSDYTIGNAGILLYASSHFIYSRIKSKNKKPKIPEELKVTVEEISMAQWIINKNRSRLSNEIAVPDSSLN